MAETWPKPARGMMFIVKANFRAERSRESRKDGIVDHGADDLKDDGSAGLVDSNRRRWKKVKEALARPGSHRRG